MRHMRGMVTGGLVLLILTSIGGFWWPATAQAATCAVTNLNDSGGGSLRDRLADANCSTITFDVTGTILLAENFSTLAIRRPVVISGPGADTLTISGNKRAGVFRLTNAGNVTLSGLTIADTTGGAAISSADTALTIQNSTIRNSDRTGVANNGGSLKISNSTIRDHTNTSTTTSSGGGIYSGGADVTLDGVTLSGNTAQGGGGINFFGGQEGRSLAITNSTIVGNTSRGGSVNSAVGGGIYASGGALRIANSTIEGNKSEGAGSGLYYTTTGTQEITITNSTFSGNTSGVRGGALTWNGNGVPQLSFVTVTGNTVGDRSGAGITPSSTGTVTLRNSVVVGNRNADGSSDCSVPLRSAGANVGGDGCLSGGGGDLTVTDAATVLSPTLADNGGPTRTHALAVGSPAIDRVPLVDCAPANGVDQRGTPRPSGAACDSGAFEVVAVAPSPTPTPTPEPSPTPTPAPSVAPSPPPSPSPAPSATPPPSVAPSPSASPVPSATPKPSASPVPPPSVPPTPPATGSGGNLPGLPNTGAGGNEAGAMAMLPGYLLVGGLAVGLLVGGLVARRRT